MRRLKTLVAHLPQHSALAQVMGWWWTNELELQAMIAELGHANVVATLSAAGAKNLPKPLRLPRPSPDGEVEPEPESKLTVQAIDQFLMGR